jgi:hypothetical protein
MIKYTGSATYESVKLRMFGDGYTKDISIDLSKAPFNISFKGFFPKNVVISSVSSGSPKAVTINGDNLIILFEEPPPQVDLAHTMTESPAGRVVFDLYFIYGTGVEDLERAEIAHH